MSTTRDNETAVLGRPGRPTDVLDLYLDDLRRSEPLSREEEQSLGRRIQEGDEDAVADLAAANLRFVVKIAKEYQGMGLPLSDLIGEGNEGLMQAARKFDPEAGTKFITYAVWWIRQRITRALAEHGHSVKIPVTRKREMRRLKAAYSDLKRELGHPPTPAQTAKRADVDPEYARVLIQRIHGDVRLDAPIREDGDDPIGERIDLTDDALEAEAIGRASRQTIEAVLDAELQPRDALVVRRYYGLGGHEETLAEIGRDLGVSRERVRQLRDRAVTALSQSQYREALRTLWV